MCWRCDNPDEPEETYLRLVRAKIDEHGWFVQAVGADRYHPPFAYTVGLTDYGHAELLVNGLPRQRAHALLNNVAHDALYAPWYTSSMPSPVHATTIKVSTDVRDRLKQQATASGRTLGEHLRHLADLGDRAARFEALRAAIDATPPQARASYDREVAEWESLDRG